MNIDLEEPNILLVGGSWIVPASLRRARFTLVLDAPVKLLNGNRYEHFERTSQIAVVDGRELVVFQWASFTAVAE